MIVTIVRAGLLGLLAGFLAACSQKGMEASDAGLPGLNPGAGSAWQTVSPAQVGLDEGSLDALHADVLVAPS